MDIQKEICKAYIQEEIRLAREEGIQEVRDKYLPECVKWATPRTLSKK